MRNALRDEACSGIVEIPSQMIRPCREFSAPSRMRTWFPTPGSCWPCRSTSSSRGMVGRATSAISARPMHSPGTRWCFDMQSRQDRPTAQVISDVSAEFPHVDDHYIGRPYRFAFMQATDRSRPYDESRAGPIMEFFFKRSRGDCPHPGAAQIRHPRQLGAGGGFYDSSHWQTVMRRLYCGHEIEILS